MATHLGSEGSVAIGANTVAEVVSWSLNATLNMVEDTALGDSWKTHMPGTREWSGSLTCHWDETDTNGQTAIRSALTGASSVTLNLYPEGSSNPDTYYTGTAYVTSFSVEVGGNDEVIGATFEFMGSGTLSESTVA